LNSGRHLKLDGILPDSARFVELWAEDPTSVTEKVECLCYDVQRKIHLGRGPWLSSRVVAKMNSWFPNGPETAPVDRMGSPISFGNAESGSDRLQSR
jgi:hypothetical protein